MSANGVIGSRASLRIWCRETCRFESYQAHNFTFEDFPSGKSSFFYFHNFLKFLQLQKERINVKT